MNDSKTTSHTTVTTEAQKRAARKYQARFTELKVRLTREKAAIVREHAKQMGERVSTFIHRAVDEAMSRDQK